ncbi:conserved hypothetical protein [Vibrio chagasii]|nr:conserved hypothetical protein [Vibrio chagasii]
MKLNKKQNEQSFSEKYLTKRNIITGIAGLALTSVGAAVFYAIWTKTSGEDEYLGKDVNETLRGYTGDVIQISDEVKSAQNAYEEREYEKSVETGSSVIGEIDPSAGSIVEGVSLSTTDLINMSQACLEGSEYDEYGFHCITKLNAQGCTIDGLNASGEPCSSSNSKEDAFCGELIYDSENYDQYGRSKEGYYRSGFDDSGFGPDGYDFSGCSRQGIDRSGNPCVPLAYGPDGKDAFGFLPSGYDSEGFGRDGFNKFNCNRQGLNRQGEICDSVKFDANGKDQFGFDKVTGLDSEGYGRDGFNLQNCNRAGLNREGEPCDSVKFGANGKDQFGFDKVTGLDSEGYGRDGFNLQNCNRAGLNREGKLCKDSIFDKNGVDQFGRTAAEIEAARLRELERLKRLSECHETGFNSRGEPCGEPQFGPDGFSQYGLDSEGYGRDGFNAENCNRQGINRQGEPCGDPIFGPDGFSQYGVDSEGYGRDGFNAENCNRQGINRQGEPCGDPIYGPDGFSQYGVDSEGYGRDGFNAENCNRQGINRQGEPCGDPIYGPDGFSQYGIDKQGYGRDGFNAENCNRQGINRQGEPCGDPIYGPDGFSQYGIDKQGYGRDGFNSENFNRFNCSREGIDKNGKPCNKHQLWSSSGLGFDGRDRLGFNSMGVDIEGYRKNGYHSVTGLDRAGCSVTGYDSEGFHCATGLNSQGFDRANCNIYGRNPLGQKCINVQHTPKWGEDGYTATGMDKLGFRRDGTNIAGVNEFGVTIRGLDRLGCNAKTGKDSQGFDCVTGLNSLKKDRDGRDENGLKDGKDVLGRDSNGFYEDGYNDQNMDKWGCDRTGKDKSGEDCSHEVDIRLSEGENSLLKAYVKLQVAMVKDIQQEMEFVGKAAISEEYSSTEAETDALLNQQIIDSQQFEGVSAAAVPETTVPDSPVNVEDIRIPAHTLFSKAQIACEIDTDYAGDTCVEITEGPLAGAVLRGTYEVPNLDNPVMPRDKVLVSLNKMVFNRQSIDIEAVVVNPITMSQAVSSEVDYHRMYRWGGLMAATTLDLAQGLVIGNAIAEGASSEDSGSATNAVAVQMAIAEPIKETSDMYRAQMGRKPTARMFKDDPVGVLFTSEVIDSRVPFVFED